MILWIVLLIIIVIYVFIRFFRASVKHSAVQNAFLAKYTYERLSESEKQNVKKQTLDIMKRGGMLEEDFGTMCEMCEYSFFGLAMNELGIKPALSNEEWHHVKSPYMALHNSDHQVQVVTNHLLKKHSVSINMEKFKDLGQMFRDSK